MADDCRFPFQPADDLFEVVCDLTDRFVCERFRIRVGLAHGFGVVGPAWHQGRVAGILKHFPPSVPTAGQQPKTVHEHHGLSAGSVRALDLLRLVFRDHEMRSLSAENVSTTSYKPGSNFANVSAVQGKEAALDSCASLRNLPDFAIVRTW